MLAGMKNRAKRKKQENIQWGRSLIITGILIFLIVAASFGVTKYISHMEEERSFERLYEEAGNLADSIEKYAENDREELEMLSVMISQYSDLSSPELWDFLNSYNNVGMMSHVEILLPGDVVLTRSGESIDAGGLLSFEEAAARGAHITDRETDIVHKDTYVARHYVPVRWDGEIIAMLYGVIPLGEIPEGVSLNPYGGKGAIYIIDGKTGDFLIDTWHIGQSGNMWEFGGREMAPGYNDDQLKQGIIDGESNYVVFVSKTTGEYLYFYYEPMEINEWRIAVSVPESVVFESARAINGILNAFLVFELVCFVVYFLWMAWYVRNVTGEKQKRLDVINHMYNVERLLFNAHEKRKNVYAALEKLGDIIGAEKVSFWALEADKWYLWEEGKQACERRKNGVRKGVRKLIAFFAAGNEEYESGIEKEFREMFPVKEMPGIDNVIAVPVEGMEGQICGILAACNLKNSHEQIALLKNMRLSFSMFCNNLKNYTDIQEQGDRDTLTGLYNRNRYEKELPEIYAQHKGSLACVYIDANGLRETNNTKGHDYGDEMLRIIGREIKNYFDTKYIYRTGGDEFVLFIPGGDEENLTRRSKELKRALSVEDYSISVGIRSDRNISSISLLIKEAEQRMYREKKEYYNGTFGTDGSCQGEISHS